MRVQVVNDDNETLWDHRQEGVLHAVSMWLTACKRRLLMLSKVR